MTCACMKEAWIFRWHRLHVKNGMTLVANGQVISAARAGQCIAVRKPPMQSFLSSEEEVVGYFQCECLSSKLALTFECCRTTEYK